jgi:mono/diheme cytochrome c family protein
VRVRWWVIVGVAVVLLGCGSDDGPGTDTSTADGSAAAADLERGERLFDANCAACHGEGASGTPSGPPLVHEIYEPGHHSDESFQLAVARGSTQHHWDFGPMPAIPGLDRDEVADITAYIRELQRDAGIID